MFRLSAMAVQSTADFFKNSFTARKNLFGANPEKAIDRDPHAFSSRKDSFSMAARSLNCPAHGVHGLFPLDNDDQSVYRVISLAVRTEVYMTETSLLEHLEEVAHRLGIELRYENLNHGGFRTEGGFCRLEGKSMILLNRKDSCRKKIRVLARSLGKANIEGIFVPPAVRNIIEEQTH
jgi:hypothetical protein